MAATQLELPGLSADLDLVFREAHVCVRPRTPVPDIQVEFFPFAGLNHTARFQDGRLRVRVSDLFQDAPPSVIRALALILLAKLYGKKVDHSHHRTYRSFILREEIQERARLARSTRGRRQRQLRARGRHADLDECFERLNRAYFAGALHKPRISWSMKRSRYVLGRYDATHDTIFVSRVFDAPDVPPYVLDYVMFHEMLHVKHRSRIDDCRILVHTPEFKAEEKRFAYFEQARRWLKHI